MTLRIWFWFMLCMQFISLIAIFTALTKYVIVRKLVLSGTIRRHL